MRPRDPSFRGLPLLAERRRQLETCVYCPKLCRSACPVSNAEPRESLTPWGKMSGAFFVATEAVEAAPSFTKLPYACTGCEACAHACDHGNPVADTLEDTRAALFEKGLADPAALDVSKKFAARSAELPSVPASSSAIGILVGCTYHRKLPAAADDAIFSARAMLGELRVVSTCCGASLGMAGDRKGQRDALEKLAKDTRGMKTLVVADAGCAHSLVKKAPALGVRLDPKIVTLVEVAEEHLEELAPIGDATAAPRYHDPCHLGRGLGQYGAPRAILTRLFGAPPREMHDHHAGSLCSGGGGLLPLTMPDVSMTIARERAAQANGEHVVTACASSVRRLRKAGANADDIATLIARSLREKAP